jgi:hypothetical protein
MDGMATTEKSTHALTRGAAAVRALMHRACDELALTSTYERLDDAQIGVATCGRLGINSNNAQFQCEQSL